MEVHAYFNIENLLDQDFRCKVCTDEIHTEEDRYHFIRRQCETYEQLLEILQELREDCWRFIIYA